MVPRFSSSSGITQFINGVPIFIGGQGRGGDLTVVATESISIAGQDSEGFRSGLFSNTNGSGDAGGLHVSTPLLSMDGGRIVTRTLGEGNAGDIEVKTGRLTLTGGAQIFSGIGDVEAGAVRGTQGPGRGGNVTVMATESIFIAGRDSEGFLSSIASNAQIGRGAAGNIALTTGQLTLTDSAQISSDTSSGGAAGNIALTMGRLTLTDGAQISSSNRGGTGRGGRLTVTATESITLTGQDSEGFKSGLFSNTNGAGDAGGLLVSTPLLSIDGGRIVTRTLGEGNAGDLEIQTGRLTLTGGAQILSGIGRSAGGTVIGTDGPGRGGISPSRRPRRSSWRGKTGMAF